MSATAAASVQESEKPNSAGTASTSHPYAPETSMHDIAKLAYVLWQQRGCPYGTPEFDWFEAERKLRESSEQVSR